MIMEIREIKTLRLIKAQKIKSLRKYKKMCNKLTKWVLKHEKNKRILKNVEFLVRVRNNSYVVKNGNYGFVVGLKKSTSR